MNNLKPIHYIYVLYDKESIISMFFAYITLLPVFIVIGFCTVS